MKVYTTGTRAEVYHLQEDCGRLARDSTDVSDTTLELAEKRSLEPCKLCHGQLETTHNGGGKSMLERILDEQEAV